MVDRDLVLARVETLDHCLARIADAKRRSGPTGKTQSPRDGASRG